MGTTSRSKTGLIVAVAVVVLALAVGLGLTLFGDDDREPDGSSTSGRGGGTALQKEAEELSGALLGAGGDATSVGSARGSVDTYSDSGRMQPAVAEIVAVEAGSSGTVLRWRLKSAGAPLRLRPSTLSSSEQPALGATEVTLVDPAGKELAKPFRFRAGDYGVSCVCSSTPNEVDQTGQELSGLYPPFSQAPTRVEIRIPGFPPITGVPVTRT